MHPEVQKAVEHAMWVMRHASSAGIVSPADAQRLCQEYTQAVQQGLRTGMPQYLASRGALDASGLQRLQQALTRASQQAAASGVNNSLHASGQRPPHPNASGAQRPPHPNASGVQRPPHPNASGVQRPPHPNASGVQPAQARGPAAPPRPTPLPPTPTPTPAGQSRPAGLRLQRPAAPLQQASDTAPIPLPRGGAPAENLAERTLLDVDMPILRPPGAPAAQEFDLEVGSEAQIAPTQMDPDASRTASAADPSGASASAAQAASATATAHNPYLVSPDTNDAAAQAARERAKLWASSHQEHFEPQQPKIKTTEEEREEKKLLALRRRGGPNKKAAAAFVGVVALSVAYLFASMDDRPLRRRTPRLAGSEPSVKIDPETGETVDDPTYAEGETSANIDTTRLEQYSEGPGAREVTYDFRTQAAQAREKYRAEHRAALVLIRKGKGDPSKPSGDSPSRPHYPTQRPGDDSEPGDQARDPLPYLPFEMTQELRKQLAIVRELIRLEKFKEALEQTQAFSKQHSDPRIEPHLATLKDEIKTEYERWKQRVRAELDEEVNARCFRRAWTMAVEGSAQALEGALVNQWKRVIMDGRKAFLDPAEQLKSKTRIEFKELEDKLKGRFLGWKLGTGRLYNTGAFGLAYERHSAALAKDLGAPESEQEEDLVLRIPRGERALVVHRLPIKRLIDVALEVEVLSLHSRDAKLALVIMNRAPFKGTQNVIGIGTLWGSVPCKLVRPINAISLDPAAPTPDVPRGTKLRIGFSVKPGDGSITATSEIVQVGAQLVTSAPQKIEGLNSSHGYIAVFVSGADVRFNSLDIRGQLDAPRLLSNLKKWEKREKPGQKRPRRPKKAPRKSSPKKGK